MKSAAQTPPKPGRKAQVTTRGRGGLAVQTARPAPDVALEVVSASVPRHIIAEVKKRVGKRGFSQFVARSLARELQRENQRSFIAEAEAAVGPIDAKAVARAERLLRS
jgi:hypothetical protein